MQTKPAQTLISAAELGLASCEICGEISRLAPLNQGKSICPRCGSYLALRKPNAIHRAWALLIAAYILFIPANLLPIMETGSLFGEQNDTIMSGVLYLVASGSWPLALIVFIASILVPTAKLLCLTYLLVTTQRGSATGRQQRARLYRALEFVGRWSMLDIYVVTILSVLVQLKGLANIYPMPGTLAFGAVVVLTMLATHSFDPRLIWDTSESKVPHQRSD